MPQEPFSEYSASPHAGQVDDSEPVRNAGRIFALNLLNLLCGVQLAPGPTPRSRIRRRRRRLAHQVGEAVLAWRPPLMHGHLRAQIWGMR
eukprot:6053975-Pleurochrysis_carterae.AAC.2